MNVRERHIVFAGGGTGGHLYPAIAIADALVEKKLNLKPVFIGSNDRLEARVVPECGYEFIGLEMSSFPRRISARAVKSMIMIIKSIIQVKKILNIYQPVCVVGTGGFVAAPVIIAALGGYHTVIHEQNTVPGLATKLLYRYVNHTFVSFESTKKYLRQYKNVSVSGNPVRRDNNERTTHGNQNIFGLDPGKITVLVFGGSLGAESINKAIANNAAESLNHGIQLIWQTGERMYDELANRFGSMENIRLFKYINDMKSCYTIADVVVCRAGATSIAEISAYGLASILVPYPHAANDHQRKNAEELRNRNACMVVEDAEASHDLYATLLQLIRNEEARNALRENIRKVNLGDAAITIATYIMRQYGVEDGRG